MEHSVAGGGGGGGGGSGGGAGRALGKCVSASHICAAARPIVTLTNLSRSQHALTPGFILRATGTGINITKVTYVAIVFLDSSC